MTSTIYLFRPLQPSIQNGGSKVVHLSKVASSYAQTKSNCKDDSLNESIVFEKARGLGSNFGEDMNVCKCTVPSRHGGTQNSRRAASPLVRLVTGEERREAPDPPLGCSPSKLGWIQAKSYCHLYGAQGYGQRQAYI
ncbi:hypothetical protein TNCV_2627001 [Trichonephila clavipes]|uniref:Uncharacterized protein n=1 Tax=Trichonephila clavipes TaxID=2585209 RepID=A0A8X6W7G1_TRICX|nr:hypothetical protein TNCV_2627001 [Trichonephila clavipes]